MFGSESGVALLKSRQGNRDLYRAVAWGWNEHGNCFVGSLVTDDVFHVTEMEVPGAPGLRIVDVWTFYASTFVLTIQE